MRRLVFGSLITGFVVLSSFTLVGGQSDPVTPPTEVRATPGSLTNMIGEVDVPWEILEYVQMKYEGHAVTKADKIKRGSSELYRLKVARGDLAPDHESTAVLFDMQWKLVGEERYAAAPPPPPAPKVQQPTRNEEVEDKPEQGQEVEAPPQQLEGGRGAGNDPEAIPSDDAEEEVEAPPTEQPRTRRSSDD